MEERGQSIYISTGPRSLLPVQDQGTYAGPRNICSDHKDTQIISPGAYVFGGVSSDLGPAYVFGGGGAWIGPRNICRTKIAAGAGSTGHNTAIPFV